MKINERAIPAGCKSCEDSPPLGFPITMAFQPIVNVATKKVFAQEALVRGPQGEGAGVVFQQVNDNNRYRFDQTCRTTAVMLASKLGIDSYVSINFMPNAVYRPELCIRATLEAAERYQFPIDQIIFEITEGEEMVDHEHLKNIVDSYKARGFKTAIDDFGAGYSGLNLLADLSTDYVKLDLALVRNIDKDKVRQAIVKGVLQVCHEIKIQVIAEGVESQEEIHFLRDQGVELFQGFYFAKPSFESLAQIANL